MEFVKCKCGCGELRPKRDKQNKLRYYIMGHALRKQKPTFKCKFCGKEFQLSCNTSIAYRETRKFCSPKCYHEFQRTGKNPLVTREKRICGFCDKEFFAIPSRIKDNRGKYCSKKCGYLAQRNRIEFKCKNCGKIFKIFPSQVRLRNAGTCCSMECRDKYYVGKRRYNWKGKTKTTDGYVQVSFSNGYRKREHRIVVEKAMGRRLERFEIVHHIDKDRKNNDLSNLMVFGSASDHSRWHWNNNESIEPIFNESKNAQ